MFNPVRLPSVDAADVADDAFLLDVREPDEWTAGHAPGAVHVPMMSVPGQVAVLPTDRTVVVICRHGQRSAQVVNYLIANGVEKAVNLDGGMLGWVGAGRSIITDDGRDPYIA